MNICIFLVNILSKLSYKINRISAETDTSCYKFISSKDNYKFYLQKDKEIFEAVTLPQQVNKLMNLEIIEIEKNGILYKIKPFEYIKMIKYNEEISLGIFDRLAFEKKSVVCYYINGNSCGSTQKCKSRIMFVFQDTDLKIEKYFAGEASSYVFKVTGRFIGEKRECHILHYLPDKKEAESVLETSEVKEQVVKKGEEIPLNVIEKLRLQLQEKYQKFDTDDNREEL